MNVRNQILEDIKTAMKSGDTFARDTLRLLNSALKQIEVDERVELSDERVFAILQTQIKRRHESAEQYRAGGREDLADKELKEAELIGSYLPAQLSDEELEAKMREIIARIGASGAKDMGAVMKAAKEELGSACEGKRMSEWAKKLLA